MVFFTIDQLRPLMSNSDNIRNISIIGHADHGKTRISDALIKACGIILKENIGEENAQTFSLKSNQNSLYFQFPEEFGKTLNENREFLINLFDPSGNIDYSCEIHPNLRISDGTLLVVDCIEGVCIQTETYLRQAISERIVPILTINKLDRAFFELQLESEEIYQNLVRILENTNVIISTYKDSVLGDILLNPKNGTVTFSCGYQNWGFNLNRFARIYSTKFGIDKEKLMERLWGENFFDSKEKKWTNKNVSSSGKPLKRAFCQFILDPIFSIFKTCLDPKLEENNNNSDSLDKILNSLNISLTSEQKSEKGKNLFKIIMENWIPIDENLLETMILNLPSPKKAQKYKVENLYTGPLDDLVANSIGNCDPKGPLVIYITKMIPSFDKFRFFAFGRVFSGTLNQNQKVNILGPNYKHGKKEDFFQEKSIQKIVLNIGKKIEFLDSISAGNICLLQGIDQFLVKTGTVISDNEISPYPLVTKKVLNPPPFKVSVQPKKSSDLPKLIKGLHILSKPHQEIKSSIEDSGELTIAGPRELTLLIEELNQFMGESEIVVSKPFVLYQETVTQISNELCLSNSPNKHNRLYVEALPLEENLVEEIEKGKISPKDDPDIRGKYLGEKYGWNILEAKKIWSFGPTDGNETNLLVDCTKGIQYVKEIEESVIAGFQWVCREGVLIGENLRGVRFNLVDAIVHSDSIHRGGGQIIPTTRRVLYASQMTASPRLLEPIFLVEIQTTQSFLGEIHTFLNKRRGIIVEENTKKIGGDLTILKYHLPVAESFGFSDSLRELTTGKATSTLIFDHWKIIEEDPFEKDSFTQKIVSKIRKRKGMQVELPSLDRYLDRL